VSYCLPYSRTPLPDAVAQWARTCDMMAQRSTPGHPIHLESFGGCMLGQMCPPGLLVAISALEAIFFADRGIRSVSLSYAQQTNPAQDVEAVHALHALARKHLSDIDWHIVIYTYMGVYPRSAEGAADLLAESIRLAVRSGAARVIVKTEAEAHRIPTVAENVTALRNARAEELAVRGNDPTVPELIDTGILAEASALVDAVMAMSPDLGKAFVQAFSDGVLDVPFCLHPDNANRSRAALGHDGRLRWVSVGAMPIQGLTEAAPAGELSASNLLNMLTYVERRYDNALGTAEAINLNA
jgi:methylaspartate mutase epsilon subunit